MVGKYMLAVVLAAGCLQAGEKAAGNVTSAQGLQLNGQTVPVAGAKSWPVATGDELKTDAAPVVLTLKDGSRLVLGKQSQAKVEAGMVRLVSGTMQYELAQRSTMQVAVKSEVLPARTGLASTVANPVRPVVTAVAASETVAPPISRRRP